MESTNNEKLLYGSEVTILKRERNYNIYKLYDDTGDTIITSYNVLDGIQLIYNDVHMQSLSINLTPPKGLFEINHCREGRIECEFDSGEYLYMSKDDFVINRKDEICRESYFPLSHFHGISICIEVEKAQKEIDKYLPRSKINLEELFNRLCNNSSFMIMKSNESIGHIFAELYSVPESIKMDYFKIKILEILNNFSFEVEVENINNVDSTLEKLDYVVSSDSIILDKCKSWINLNKKIIEEKIDDKFYIDFTL